MWQRFTENARKVVFYAQEEAVKHGENYVSTEHILLGLIRDPEFVAPHILECLGISCDKVRAETERKLPEGKRVVSAKMQLTPRGRQIIDLAYDEARQLGNGHIGTEHMLLGLIREGDGLAGQVLAKLGVDLDRARQAVVEFQKVRNEDQS